MKKEVKIGIFALVTVLCAWAGLRFLKGTDLVNSNKSYYAEYDQIDGITKAASIFIHGVKVGSVSDIIFDPSKSDKVMLKLSIKGRYELPTDTKAKIFNNGLMGGKAINIELGESSTALQSGDKIISEGGNDITKIAEDKLASASAELSQIASSLNKTLAALSDMMENNTANINASLTSISGITSNFNTLLASERENLHTTLDGVAQFSSTLGENSQKIDSIITNLDSMTTQMEQTEVVAQLGATIEQLNTTLEQLNSDEGSLGKLLRDEELYNNLAGASSSLDSLLIDLKQNPKRYVQFSIW